MRIGIDARELGGHATGVGRYLGGLLAEWTEGNSGGDNAGAHEFVLYTAEPIALPPELGRAAIRIVGGPAGTWWEQVTLPRVAREDHLDVFFGPAYTLPLFLDVPRVVAIHDLSFFAHPEWFRFREGIRRRWITQRSADVARSVITISAFSRGELIDRLGVPAARLHVIPPGVHTRGGASGPREARVLYVGSIFNRRHVPDLIKAFGRVVRRVPDASLDIVGDNRSHPREDIQAAIAHEGLEGRIRWHAYLPDDMLSELYAKARAFAFLSEYEGLGLTPLEALAAGVPPVLLDTPVARESCGSAALYVPLHDLAATAHALELLLTDHAARAGVLGTAPDALANYSAARAARDTLAVLESAAR